MKRTSLAQWPCSIARSMDVLGDWWTPLVLREAFLGARRFDDFQRRLGLARNTLNTRLQGLVEEGVLERVRYQLHPERHEYVLTAKGRDFYPVLLAIMAWGDRWLDGGEGPPVVLHHHECDQDTRAEVVCEHCREPLRVGGVTHEFGPGHPARPDDSGTHR